MPPIPPGSTIGILGGGQLGRMTAMAARTLGYNVHVLDPDANCAASPVADRVIAAPFDDADAAADLARGCDVVTLEIEHLGVDALAAAERHAPVRPERGHPRDGTGSLRAEAMAGGERLSDRRVSRDPSRLRSRGGGTRARTAVREGEPRRLRRTQPGACRDAPPTHPRRGRHSPNDTPSPSRRSTSRPSSASWSRGDRLARFARIRRRSTITSDRFSRGR